MPSARVKARQKGALERLERHIKEKHSGEAGKAGLDAHLAEIEILKQRTA
jgi:hypothetical protein